MIVKVSNAEEGSLEASCMTLPIAVPWRRTCRLIALRPGDQPSIGVDRNRRC